MTGIIIVLVLAVPVAYLLGEHIGFKRGSDEGDTTPLMERRRPLPGPGHVEVAWSEAKDWERRKPT